MKALSSITIACIACLLPIYAQDSIKTQVIGITGITICGPGDNRAIAAVLPDTPASKAGIQKGDYILKIDGADTTDWKFKDIVGRIRGTPNTTVVLTVRKASNNEIVDIPLTRVALEVHEPSPEDIKAVKDQPVSDTKRPDASALSAKLTSDVTPSELSDREGLIHEMVLFEGGNKTVMRRSVWLTPDRSKIVRSNHILYVNGIQVADIIDFRETFEHHVTNVSVLPQGIHLTISEADAISPKRWKFVDGHQRILACFTRDSDGLIRPMTRSEYETMIDERIKKFPRN